MTAKFGPAGNSESFNAKGYRSSIQVPEYLWDMGLNAYEYQCGRGVNIGREKAAQLGEKAREYGVTLSLHSPYYISLPSAEEEKRINSIRYIFQSAQAIDWMGGTRVVVHPGGIGKMSRADALDMACDTLKKAMDFLDENGLSHIRLCPETMGKINQLGNLEEVMTLCSLDERLIPCIDFGHLNARTQGGLKTKEDVKRVFDTVENTLGISRLREYHAHFSKIEYTAGGEKKHLTFADQVFGPDFEPVAEVSVQKGCTPTIICESAGTQAEDALAMMTMFREAKSTVQ